MIKILPYSLMLLVFVPDGEPQYYLRADQGKPTQIVVSAYTQNGCLEELQQEAKNRGVEVKLTNVSVRVKFRHGNCLPKPTGKLFEPTKITEQRLALPLH